MNSGYYTLQIYPRAFVNMFRVKPRATLGLIFFTLLIQNSDKQWRVLTGCLKKLPLGIPSSHQTFPRGCAPRESLITLGNLKANFSRQPLRTFHCLYQSALKQIILSHGWFTKELSLDPDSSLVPAAENTTRSSENDGRSDVTDSLDKFRLL